MKSAIHKVLNKRDDVVDLNDLSEQFRSLVVNPVKIATENEQGVYYIIVIEAMDECSASGIVEMFIKAILDGMTNVPLKVFTTSRPESWIKRVFHAHARRIDLFDRAVFIETSLQEVTQDVVRNDILTYLHNSLSEIAAMDLFSPGVAEWPPADEFRILLDLSA